MGTSDKARFKIFVLFCWHIKVSLHKSDNTVKQPEKKKHHVFRKKMLYKIKQKIYIIYYSDKWQDNIHAKKNAPNLKKRMKNTIPCLKRRGRNAGIKERVNSPIRTTRWSSVPRYPVHRIPPPGRWSQSLIQSVWSSCLFKN